MPSPQHEAIVAMLQSQPLPADMPSPEMLRAFFEALTSTFPPVDGAESTPAEMGGVPGEWIDMPESIRAAATTQLKVPVAQTRAYPGDSHAVQCMFLIHTIRYVDACRSVRQRAPLA